MKVAYVLQNVGAVNLARDVGASVPLKATLRGLERRGHDVEILALRGKRVVRIREMSAMRVAGLVPQGLTGRGAFRSAERLLRAARQALGLPYYALFDNFRMYSALKRELPAHDLCHEHNGLFSIGAAAACRATGTPYVLTFDADLVMELDVVGNPLRGVHRRVAERLAAYSLEQADAILCVSEAAQRHLVSHWNIPPAKIHVLPNGVDTDLFRPGPSAAGSGCRIAFVGAFQPWHGLALLVEAFEAVRSEVPEAELILIGDGPARPELERQIRDRELEDHIEITGLLPQTRVPEMLAGADVAVLPYPELPEEFWFSPLKLYEYMAAGKAIVASRVGQIADVLDDGQTGVLVSPGSVSDLARAIIGLLKDPAMRRRLGENARQQAVDRHSWEVNVSRIELLYRDVVEEKKRN